MSFKLLELIGIRPKETQQEAEFQEVQEAAAGREKTVEQEAIEIWERCFGKAPTWKGNTTQEE